MSLILEALKKSEQQRQREKAPSLQSIHQPAAAVAPKTARPWWLFAVLLVVCNVALLGYWFWRQHDMVDSIAQPAPVSAAQPAAPAQSAVPAPPAQGGPGAEVQAEFTQISPRAMQAQPLPVDNAQRVYEISELPDSVRNNLPAMTFSFHVYSESPEQRTIIINDRRMREGDDVSGGLTLQNITPDGVILLFEQHRIHISVLSEW